jgi:hypothetical protein
VQAVSADEFKRVVAFDEADTEGVIFDAKRR